MSPTDDNTGDISVSYVVEDTTFTVVPLSIRFVSLVQDKTETLE